jgi:hypothetical protein
MMFQFFIILFVYCLLIAATTTNAQQNYNSFEGTIDDTSSWFDPSRWTGILKVPTLADTVWIDESNTYVAIDSSNKVAETTELIVGRSSSSNSMESVQVDLLAGAALNVAKNMIIGQNTGSDATVYASHNSNINIGNTLTIGSAGSGLVILSGNAQITANDIKFCQSNNGCKLIMDTNSKLKLKGNKKTKLNKMIQNGFIVSSSSSDKTNSSNESFEVTRSNGMTIVKIIINGKPPITDGFDLEEEECKDLNFKFKNKKKKNCIWAVKKNKCGKKYKGKSIGNHWCKESCGKCPVVEDVCKDLKLKIQGKKRKNCKWAAKKNKCGKKHKGKSIGKHWCKASCDTCPPNDNKNNTGGNNSDCFDYIPPLQYNGNSNKDCGWVSKKKNKRCSKDWGDLDGQTIANFCPIECGIICM